MSHDEQRARLEQLLRNAGLEVHLEAVMATARPSVRVFPEPAAEATTAVGASRFGGPADLPAANEWPHHAEQPLTFIGQIRLDEVAPLLPDNPLPEKGLLSLFVWDLLPTDEEPSEETLDAYGSVGAALYFEDVSTLISVEPPYGPGGPVPVRLCAMRFAPELCLPPVEGPDFDPVGLKGTDHHARYWDAVWANRLAFPDEPFHRLLGHPDMNFNYHMAGTRLLFQLSSDDNLDWSFGDAQDLRFLIKPKALAARKIELAVLDGSEE